MRPWFQHLAAATILVAGMSIASTPASSQSPATAPPAKTPAPATAPPAKAPPPATAPAKRPKGVIVRGEVLDLSCWLGRNLSGPLHQDCARKCLASGVPMGIITSDSTLWLLTQDHGRSMEPASYSGSPDPYIQCKDWPSYIVEVSGLGSYKNGVHVVEVSRAKIISKSAATP